MRCHQREQSWESWQRHDAVAQQWISECCPRCRGHSTDMHIPCLHPPLHQALYPAIIICVILRNIYVEDSFLTLLICSHLSSSCSVDMITNYTDFSHCQKSEKSALNYTQLHWQIIQCLSSLVNSLYVRPITFCTALVTTISDVSVDSHASNMQRE